MAKNDIEALTLRAIIIDSHNKIPFIRSHTGWFGLPGGHIKKSEVGEGIELIDFKTPLPLVREIREECLGLDISQSPSACLGIVETFVTFEAQPPTHQTVILYLIKHPEPISVNRSRKLSLFDVKNLPTPLFPDAQAAFERLSRGGFGPIIPEFLNKNPSSIKKFEMTSKRVGYLP
ncbi:MAG TPA: NUDIX hydrolase [Candidatus Methanoperedens sp.]|nr:NUDIX hydrolase [Candidatus Methanoperedens sp.]